MGLMTVVEEMVGLVGGALADDGVLYCATFLPVDSSSLTHSESFS